MKNKLLAMAVTFSMLMAFSGPMAFAAGAQQAAASLFLPTTGQAMNGELGTTKARVMAGVEVAGVTTLAILGGVVGGPVVWAAIGPLIANHVWSAADAYKGAQTKQEDPAYQQQQLMDAQRALDISRQGRYEREQLDRSDIRTRIMMAGEAAR